MATLQRPCRNRPSLDETRRDKGSRETQWDDNSVDSTDAYPVALPAAVSNRCAPSQPPDWQPAAATDVSKVLYLKETLCVAPALVCAACCTFRKQEKMKESVISAWDR